MPLNILPKCIITLKKNDQWKFIKKVEVKDADTDESISKKEFLEALY